MNHTMLTCSLYTATQHDKKLLSGITTSMHHCMQYSASGNIIGIAANHIIVLLL